VSSEVRVPVAGGELVAWEAGEGLPLLVLHGGPASDYTDSLVPWLPAGVRSIRYQQRGIAPSTTEPPFELEAHVADAVGVLEAFQLEQAWVLGHSWGAHLACHLAVAHPERVAGLVLVDGLGAVGDGGWPDLDRTIFERLAARDQEAAERAREMDERAMAGEGTDEEAYESLELVWPYYFADPDAAPPMPPTTVNADLYAAAVASVREHFERRTLERLLPAFEGPVLVVHGEDDPLPASAGLATAALLPQARVELIERCGHIPWLEQPDRFAEILAGFLPA